VPKSPGLFTIVSMRSPETSSASFFTAGLNCVAGPLGGRVDRQHLL